MRDIGHRGLWIAALLAGGTALLALAWQPVPGPIGHWKLDETAGTAAADTSGASPGAYTGTPLHDEAQKPTLAAPFLPNVASLNCDSVDDYVNIPNTPSLENITEGSYTISLWVRPAPALVNDEIRALFIKPGVGNEGIWWRQPIAGSPTSGFISMEHRLQTAAIPPTYPSISANGPVLQNVWSHVVGVVDTVNKFVYVYINGATQGSTTWGITNPTDVAADHGTTVWRIGRADFTPGPDAWAYVGHIDDVRIYNRVLSAAEVMNLFNGTALPPPPITPPVVTPLPDDDDSKSTCGCSSISQAPGRAIWFALVVALLLLLVGKRRTPSRG